jgi:hypothetical protein
MRKTEQKVTALKARERELKWKLNSKIERVNGRWIMRERQNASREYN